MGTSHYIKPANQPDGVCCLQLVRFCPQGPPWIISLLLFTLLWRPGWLPSLLSMFLSKLNYLVNTITDWEICSWSHHNAEKAGLDQNSKESSCTCITKPVMKFLLKSQEITLQIKSMLPYQLLKTLIMFIDKPWPF